MFSNKGENNSAEYYYKKAEEHKKQLKYQWKTILRSGIFVVAALIVIMAFSVAWFSNNNQGSTGAYIGTANDTIRIASKGIRQSAEETLLNLSVGGNDFEYQGETYYYTDSGEIAFRLANEYEMRPGAHGEIEFYIIPQKLGSDTVTLYLDIEGYKETIVDSKKTAQKVEDEALLALLGGHLLFFRDYEQGTYSNWIPIDTDSSNINLTIEMNDAQQNVPYKYSLYWEWPKLYSDISSIAGISDFLAEQSLQASSKQIGDTEYFYSKVFISNVFPVNELSKKSTAYNLADEYIGSNLDYIYFSIRTTPNNGVD